MPHFAYKVMKDTSSSLEDYWLGAFQPTGNTTAEGGWDWVDDTSNDNLDCGTPGCGEHADGVLVMCMVAHCECFTIVIVPYCMYRRQGYGFLLNQSKPLASADAAACRC
jgi:hypothetical protein